MAAKIFISSPCESLKNQREIVLESLKKTGFKDIFLSEADRSRDESSYETCLNEVERADLFILILGKFYGWVPDKEKYSVTELEYNKAVENGLEILAFKLDFYEYEPKQAEFIKRVEDFYRGRFRGGIIKNDSDLKDRIFSDVPQHYVNKSAATKKVPVKKLTESEIRVDFQKTKEITFPEKINIHNPPLLLIKGRINYTHEAGNAKLMKIYFNDYAINEDDLINKPKLFQLKDTRVRSWFDQHNHTWSLPYSPNFKSNYFHFKYKIMNGDPYTLLFSLQNTKLKSEKNKVKIIHAGSEDYEAYKNSIIIANCQLIK